MSHAAESLYTPLKLSKGWAISAFLCTESFLIFKFWILTIFWLKYKFREDKNFCRFYLPLHPWNWLTCGRDSVNTGWWMNKWLPTNFLKSKQKFFLKVDNGWLPSLAFFHLYVILTQESLRVVQFKGFLITYNYLEFKYICSITRIRRGPQISPLFLWSFL